MNPTKDVDRMTNSADPDQAAPTEAEQSNLGLLCLLRCVYPNIKSLYHDKFLHIYTKTTFHTSYNHNMDGCFTTGRK